MLVGEDQHRILGEGLHDRRAWPRGEIDIADFGDEAWADGLPTSRDADYRCGYHFLVGAQLRGIAF